MARSDILGPIFWLDAITKSRRARYFVLRGVYACVLLYALWNVYESAASGGQVSLATKANVAASFFQTFAFVQLIAIMIVTPAMVSSTIAQERERRTIDFLLASPLTNVEIVLGKMGAGLAQVAMLLVTGLPILAMAMLLGGIAPESLVQVYMATAASLLLTGGVSILASTGGKTSSEARKSAYWALVVIWACSSMLIGVLRAVNGGMDSALMDWVASFNPLYSLFAIFYRDEMQLTGSPWEYALIALIVQGSIGVMATALAVALIRDYDPAGNHHAARGFRPGVGKEEDASSANEAVRAPLPPDVLVDDSRVEAPPATARAAATSANAAKDRQRELLLDHDPVLWKELHGMTNSVRVIVKRANLSVAVAVLIMSAFYQTEALLSGSPYDADVVLYVPMVGGTLIVCLGLWQVLSAATTSITSEKDRDCWASLISTPLNARDIVSAKIKAALHAGKFHAAMAATLWAAPMLMRPALLIPFSFTCLTTAVAAAFAAALGVGISLRAKSSHRATMGAILAAIVLSGSYALCFLPSIMSSRSSLGTHLVYAYSIPYLVATPSIMATSRPGPIFESGIQALTYATGLIGYAVVGAIAVGWSLRNFDALAGRVSPRNEPPRGMMNSLEGC